MKEIIAASQPHVYVKNMKFILKGRFTVYGQLYLNLYLRIESMGYKIPDMGKDNHRIRPHKSVGPLFQEYLRNNYFDRCDQFVKVDFIDDDEIDYIGIGHYQYSNNLLTVFAYYFEKIWVKEHAEKYFQTKDPNVLEYLPKLLSEKADKPNLSIANPTVEQLNKEIELQKKIREIVREANAKKYGPTG